MNITCYIKSGEIHNNLLTINVDINFRIVLLFLVFIISDWLNNMSKDIKSIKTKPKEYQRNWIRQFIRSISVEYDDKTKSHNLKINFHVGLVNDTYEKKGRDERGDLIYDIIEGKRNMKLTHKWVKRTERIDEKYLENTIIQIKLLKSKGFSNIQICENLNEQGVKTIRNRLWNKGSLIKFRNKYITPETIPK